MKRVILSALAAGIFATAAAQEELTLRKCLEIGLENNYDIRIVRNEERISDNNATAANAGMVPTIDFEAGYSGALDNERTTPREGDAWSDNGIYDQTFNAGISLNWTIFDDSESAPTTKSSKRCRRWALSAPASRSKTS